MFLKNDILVFKQKLYFKLIALFIFFSSCEERKSIDLNTVFRYNEHKNINSLDPIFAKDIANIQAVNQLFNGLVEMDKELNVVPSVAKSWKISENGKLYSFNINTSVEFHPHPSLEKRNVTAYDFEYSFNRLLDPKNASPGRWIFDKVDSFKAKNDSIFEIKLKNPFNAFLGLLTMKYCSVVPKNVVEFYDDDFRSNPIGTGPFKFKRWEENIKLVLRKNEKYFQKDSIGNQLPYLEAVSITFLPEKQSEFLQLVKGKIDFVSGLDNSYKDEIITNDGRLNEFYKDKIEMLRGPYLNTEYLAFFLKSEKNEIKSELIRKAINIGFDKRKMLKFLRNGVGIPAEAGFIPSGLPGYKKNDINKYNPELAKSYVKTYKEKYNPTPSLTLTTSSNYLDLCEFIQKELEKIGVEINIDVIPGSALKQAKANGKLDFFRASWIADYPDAENYLSLFYSKNLAPDGPNYTHFSNYEYDKIYENSLRETNPEKSKLLYQKMDSIITSKSIIVPLFYDEVVRFISKNVVGMDINATNLLDLRNVRKVD
ncbi:MAG: ABC transporter substrate-binding protein [Flavobacteriaceae bacterium]|nr:ABC transporter substrate-binding protein [Flavobacteriaceae bacterium]|tara:strand:- start:12217 stop:13833 length:1617 start_codon:yes stop_codon:yes gene_type:complete